MNGNTRSITVRLTPKQAVYLASMAGRDYQPWDSRQVAVFYRAAANIEEALHDAGWVPDGRGWRKAA